MTASSGSQFLAVNPATDRIYDGDAVIDGATDKVIERLGFNSSGIAVDLTRNLVVRIDAGFHSKWKYHAQDFQWLH